ncbi:beta-lactamase class A [Anaerobacterium chartisolvens]|uniref:Beta-lactamase class A n=1 Tax=Anaerobacterium chartisolvens TaxID=1297424 RepID=A0A369B956_9FIRM|nr:serine hydrolase [Anaerobacterium chartisolvens]RCX17941.1 beta-lactamase class A [Anaerobacterium chartisolvens]
MGFRGNIPIDIRVSGRRRRLNFKRLFTVIGVIVIIAGTVAFVLNRDKIFKKPENEVFMPATSAAKTQNTTEQAALTTFKEDIGEAAFIGGARQGVRQGRAVYRSLERSRMDEFKSELEDYVSTFKGQYGIYFWDLNTDISFGINESDEYLAASTVKIPINLYLFNKIKDGEIDPEEKLVYTKSTDYEAGTGRIQYQNDGTEYTIRELSALSIRESDNVAVNMLIRKLDRQNYKDYMKQSGGVVVTEKNESCPSDMALYMKAIYDFYNENPDVGGELIDSLQSTIYNDRIPKLLPKAVKVAHKVGNQLGALHDIGLVFADRPYVIAIMSKNINEEEGYDVIANISKKVYDFVQGK